MSSEDLPSRLFESNGVVTFVDHGLGLIKISTSDDVFVFFSAVSYKGKSRLQQGADVLCNAYVLPKEHRRPPVQYMARTVWLSDQEVPSSVFHNMVAPLSSEEIEDFECHIDNILREVEKKKKEDFTKVDYSALGSVLAMQGIIEKKTLERKPQLLPNEEAEPATSESDQDSPTHSKKKKKKKDKKKKKKRKKKKKKRSSSENESEAESQELQPQKKSKKKKKSKDDAEDIPHHLVLHKLNDMIAELEKETKDVPQGGSEEPGQTDGGKDSKVIAYPEPGVAYDPAQTTSWSHHRGYNNPTMMSNWLGLASVPGAKSESKPPVVVESAPAPELSPSSDSSDSEDYPKASVFEKLYGDERIPSPEHGDDVPTQAFYKKSTQGDSGAVPSKSSTLAKALASRLDRDKQPRVISPDGQEDTSRSEAREGSEPDSRKRNERDRDRDRREKRSHDRDRSRDREHRDGRSHGRDRKDDRNHERDRRDGESRDRHRREDRKRRDDRSRDRDSDNGDRKGRSDKIRARTGTRDRSRSRDRRRNDVESKAGEGRDHRSHRSRSKTGDAKPLDGKRKSEKEKLIARRVISCISSGSEVEEWNEHDAKASKSKKRKGKSDQKQNTKKMKREKEKRTVLRWDEEIFDYRECSVSTSSAGDDTLEGKKQELEPRSPGAVSRNIRKSSNKDGRGNFYSKNRSPADTPEAPLIDDPDEELALERIRRQRAKTLGAPLLPAVTAQLNEMHQVRGEDELVSSDSGRPTACKASRTVLAISSINVNVGQTRNIQQIGGFICDTGFEALSNNRQSLGSFKRKRFFSCVDLPLVADMNDHLAPSCKTQVMGALGLTASTSSTTPTFFYRHRTNGNVKCCSEKKMLLELLQYVENLPKPVTLLLHYKDALLPILIARMKKFKLLDTFCELVESCCDLVGLVWNLGNHDLWVGNRYPSVSKIAEDIGCSLPQDASEGPLSADEDSKILAYVASHIIASHNLSQESFAKLSNDTGLLEFTAVKYNAIQAIESADTLDPRPALLELLHSNEKWGDKVRLDLVWSTAWDRPGQSATMSSGRRERPLPEPRLLPEDEDETTVTILKHSDRASSDGHPHHQLKDSREQLHGQETWEDKTYNAFLAAGEICLDRYSTKPALLRVPALNLRMGELPSEWPVRVESIRDLTNSRLFEVESGQSLLAPMEGNIYPAVKVRIRSLSHRPLTLNSDAVTEPIAAVRLKRL